MSGFPRGFATLAILLTLCFGHEVQAQSGASGDSYRIKLGDRIKVQVAGQEALTQEIVVFTSGEISCPGIGKVIFHGKAPATIEKEISTALEARKILGSEVSVLVMDVIAGVVYIQGAISKPMEANLPAFREMRLSHFIAVASGLLPAADAKRLKVHRLDPAAQGGKKVLTIDYERVASGEDPAGDLVLQDGDSVFVPSRPVGSFSIAGEVNRPGEYAMGNSGQTTIARAVVRAGGFGEFSNPKKVSIHRDRPDGTTETLTVDVNEILKEGNLSKDVPIFPGDLIFVPKRLF